MKQLSHILLLLPLVAALSAAAQEPSLMTFGMTTTYGTPWIVNQNNNETLEDCPVIAHSELDYRVKTGYNAGLSAGYMIEDNFSVQGKLLFATAGQHYKDSFSPGDNNNCPNPYNIERYIDLYYLQLPVLLRFTAPLSRGTKLYGQFGPQLSFLTAAQERVLINGAEKLDLDPPASKFNKVDFGITAGFGMDIFLHKNLFLNTGFDFYYGLTDINSERVKSSEWFQQNDVSYEESHNFNAGLTLGLNYIFTVKEDNPFQAKK